MLCGCYDTNNVSRDKDNGIEYQKGNNPFEPAETRC